MFSLIKQVFIVLLSFSESLATKYLFLNDEPYMVRPAVIDLNPVELKYYPFTISLDKCTGICNVLSPKICATKETKDINVKVFNMITSKSEAKEMTKHISCYCKCKFNSTTCNLKQKWKNKTCQYECKNYHKCENDYSWNPSRSICENSKYLKGITDTSVIEFDEIITVMDTVSTKKANTAVTNVTSTASMNSHSKKSKRLFYFVHSFISSHITIDDYYYLLSLCKTKRYNIK